MPPFDFLTPSNALIFRIVHIDNIEWILDNGLHCYNSEARDPEYIDIGNTEIIDRRLQRTIDVEPRGTLSDYIPFYFTSSSIMLYNILTGHNVPQKQRSEIIILVTQLTLFSRRGIRFVFSDRHALLLSAHFFGDLGNLETAIDWQILQQRDFSRTNDDPGKLERYQAEALI